jgi:hypothetical protein
MIIEKWRWQCEHLVKQNNSDEETQYLGGICTDQACMKEWWAIEDSEDE